MKFKTHNDQDINLIGTSRQGYLTIQYSTLVEIFGEPDRMGDGYKVDAEWAIEFEDGTVAAIYNYKNGQNYLGEAGTPIEKITSWNIGGYEKRVVQLVMEVLNHPPEDH